MLPLGDGSDHLADVDPVLDDRVAGAVVLERHLVADRNIARRRDGDVLVVFHDPAVERLTGSYAFDDDDADAVALFMHHEMDHGCSGHLCLRGNVILFACSTAAASCRRSPRWQLRPPRRSLALRISGPIPSP